MHLNGWCTCSGKFSSAGGVLCTPYTLSVEKWSNEQTTETRSAGAALRHDLMSNLSPSVSKQEYHFTVKRPTSQFKTLRFAEIANC